MDNKFPVTHRDGYIIAKALAYAIAHIDRLPEARQEASDRGDMVAIFHAMVPGAIKREEFARGVEAATGILPDLTDWKAGDPPEWKPEGRR